MLKVVKVEMISSPINLVLFGYDTNLRSVFALIHPLGYEVSGLSYRSIV